MSRTCVARVGQVWRAIFTGNEWQVVAINLDAEDVCECVTLKCSVMGAATKSDLYGRAMLEPKLGTPEEFVAAYMAQPLMVEPTWFECGAAKLVKEAA